MTPLEQGIREAQAYLDRRNRRRARNTVLVIFTALTAVLVAVVWHLGARPLP